MHPDSSGTISDRCVFELFFDPGSVPDDWASLNQMKYGFPARFETSFFHDFFCIYRCIGGISGIYQGYIPLSLIPFKGPYGIIYPLSYPRTGGPYALKFLSTAGHATNLSVAAQQRPYLGPKAGWLCKAERVPECQKCNEAKLRQGP